MNTTVITDTAPAIDPLDTLDLDQASLPASVPVAGALVVRPELPLVILTTVTKPGSLIDVSRISAAEIAEIGKLQATLTLDDDSAVTMFGTDMQKQYSNGLSQLLGQSTLGDTGLYNFIAQDLQLSTEIVQQAIEKFGEKEGEVGFFRKALRALPVIGGHVTTAEVMIESRRRLTEVFDRMETGVADRQRSIIEKEAGLDILFGNIKGYLLLLRRHILAGERALVAMYEQYKQEVAQLPENPDPIEVADLVAKKNRIIGFEVRLIGLKTAYVKAGTLLPAQLQGIKQAGQITLANLRDTVAVTIPDLKTSALQLTALTNLAEANAQSQGIRNQAAIAAQQAQDLIGRVTVSAKEQQGEALNEAQRLQGLLTQMNALRETVAGLDAENTQKRAQAEELLIQSQYEFVEAERRTAQKFLELAQPVVTAQ